MLLTESILNVFVKISARINVVESAKWMLFSLPLFKHKEVALKLTMRKEGGTKRAKNL